MAFDIFEYASGTTHPKDTVDIYNDRATAYQISRIEAQLDKQHRLLLPEAEIEKLEKENKRLRKVLDKSKVVVTLQGLSTAKREEIQAEVDTKFGEDSGDEENKERSDLFEALTFAASFVQAEDSSGEVSEPTLTAETASKFLLAVPEESRTRINQKMIDLVVKSNEFEVVETSAVF